MADSNTDLFDPRAAIGSDHVLGASTSSRDSDFGFAFDDSNFSDRLLRIEIVGESDETEPDASECSSIADWARRKRRREDKKTENGNLLSLFLFSVFEDEFCLYLEKMLGFPLGSVAFHMFLLLEIFFLSFLKIIVGLGLYKFFCLWADVQGLNLDKIILSSRVGYLIFLWRMHVELRKRKGKMYEFKVYVLNFGSQASTGFVMLKC